MFMRRNSISWWTRIAAIATGAAMLAVGNTPARAQRDTESGGRPNFQRGAQQRGMQNWYQSPINQAELQRMFDQLNMDEGQQDIANSLLQGFRASLEGQMESARQKFQDKRQELIDNRDWQAMMSTGITMARQWHSQATAIEGSFLADVQGVLTRDQLAQWPSYNRGLKRRSANVGASRIGALSGENIDLCELLEEFELDDATRASLDPALEAYGIELEPAIENRQRLIDKVTEALAGGFENLDPEEMENQFNSLIRARTLVRDLNDRYLQLIQASLPGEVSSELGTIYREKAYRGVYRATRADNYLDTVAGLDSLTDAQRTALDGISFNYESQLGTVNEQLAAIQRKTEIDNQRRVLGRFQQMSQGGFGRGRGGFGAAGGFEPSEEEQQRRDLNDKKNQLVRNTIIAISTALTPDQLTQAPVPEERAQRGARGRDRGDFTPEQREEFRRRMQERAQRDRSGN